MPEESAEEKKFFQETEVLLKPVCNEFHMYDMGSRGYLLYGVSRIAMKALIDKVNTFSTGILTKHSYLLNFPSKFEPKTQQPVQDSSAKGLQIAAGCADCPFKKALAALMKNAGVSASHLRVKALPGIDIIQRKLDFGTPLSDLNVAHIIFNTEAEFQAIYANLAEKFTFSYMVNSFLSKCEDVTNTPCIKIGIELSNAPNLPSLANLKPLLLPGQAWVVEIQLHMYFYLKVTKEFKYLDEFLKMQDSHEEKWLPVREEKSQPLDGMKSSPPNYSDTGGDFFEASSSGRGGESLPAYEDPKKDKISLALPLGGEGLPIYEAPKEGKVHLALPLGGESLPTRELPTKEEKVSLALPLGGEGLPVLDLPPMIRKTSSIKDTLRVYELLYPTEVIEETSAKEDLLVYQAPPSPPEEKKLPSTSGETFVLSEASDKTEASTWEGFPAYQAPPSPLGEEELLNILGEEFHGYITIKTGETSDSKSPNTGIPTEEEKTSISEVLTQKKNASTEERAAPLDQATFHVTTSGSGSEETLFTIIPEEKSVFEEEKNVSSSSGAAPLDQAAPSSEGNLEETSSSSSGNGFQMSSSSGSIPEETSSSSGGSSQASLSSSSDKVVEVKNPSDKVLDCKLEEKLPVFESEKPKIASNKIKIPELCPICAVHQYRMLFDTLTDLRDVDCGGGASKKRGKLNEKDISYYQIAVRARVGRKGDIFLKNIPTLTRLQHPSLFHIRGIILDEVDPKLGPGGYRVAVGSKDRSPQMGYVGEWNEQSIDEFLANNEVPSNVLFNIASQVIEGLCWLHKEDIIHGWLKPESILCITDPLRVQICDTGFSREDAVGIGASSSMSSECGIRWKAPEAFNKHTSERRTRPETDVYAFGCFLIELFSEDGEKKHLDVWGGIEGRDLERELEKKVLKGELPPQLAMVRNSDLQNLIRNCLIFDADERPSIQEVKERLVELQAVFLPPPPLLSSVPSMPPSFSSTPSMTPPSRRSRSYCAVVNCFQMAKGSSVFCFEHQ
jgi:hypothetical protein